MTNGGKNNCLLSIIQILLEIDDLRRYLILGQQSDKMIDIFKRIFTDSFSEATVIKTEQFKEMNIED